MTARVAVLGATGRMGRLVVAGVLGTDDLVLAAAIARERSATVGRDAGELVGVGACGVPISPLNGYSFRDVDVIIDFSLPEALEQALPHLGSAALVSGTTGLSGALRDRLDRRARSNAVLHASNFSTGVNLLLHLVAEAARALPDYDVEIVEAHHRHKEDAPSGTAIALGMAAASARGRELDAVATHGRHGRTGARPAGQIAFHAVRMGDVVGEHDVWLAGAGERVRLGHVASSRATFAQGAIRAARWIVGRPPGRYSMRDVLGI